MKLLQTTTTPESKIDDYLVTENNREDEVIEAAGDHLGKRVLSIFLFLLIMKKI
jgi:hypothetical protein